MTILFLHGRTSTPGGVKPSYLKNHGHEVLNTVILHSPADEKTNSSDCCIFPSGMCWMFTTRMTDAGSFSPTRPKS